MGQRCRVLTCGTMYTCLVEFADGFRMVTTTNAVTKAEPDSHWLGAAGGVGKQGIIVLTYTPSGGGTKSPPPFYRPLRFFARR